MDGMDTQGMNDAANQQPPAEPQDSGKKQVTKTAIFRRDTMVRQINWMPWGEEAFQRAREQDKPVFLTIGYRTCHWCEQMKRQTFADPAVARLLNELFIPVKLDRELRPDVDAIYQYGAKGAGRSGGWPLSVVMDDLRRPFFLAAFMPPLDSPNKIGFISAMQRVLGAWKDRRGSVAEDAERMAAFLKTAESAGVLDEEAKKLGIDTLKTTLTHFVRQFDTTYGGFGRRPKFLPTSELAFLQRARHLPGAERINGMINLTLRRLARGGIRDHVGGGFHRYSVDDRWHQPHFGKALGDQARVIQAFLEAVQQSGDPFYRKVVRTALDFVLRDMPIEGTPAFLTAVGADPDGASDKDPRAEFYTYADNELVGILGESDAAIISNLYGFMDGGNYTDESTDAHNGRNILHFGQRGVAGVGGLAATDPDLVNPRVGELLAKLLEHRSANRKPPATDDKLITSHNAAMVSALARAGWILKDDSYITRARELLDFLLANLRDDEGELFHCWANGKAFQPAFLDDYTYLAKAAFDVYQVTFDLPLLNIAIELCEDFLGRFADLRGGGLYFAQDVTDGLVARRKELTDEFGPNGNAIAAELLLRLGRLCERDDFEQAASDILQGFSREMKQRPSNFPQMMVSLELMMAKGQEIIISVPDSPKEGTPPLSEFLDVLRRRFMPRTAIAMRKESEAAEILELIPYTKRQVSAGGSVCVYVCSAKNGSSPISDPEALARMLDSEDVKARS